MKESNLQSKFGIWLKINKMEGVFELKLEKGKSFAFNKVKDHQVKALYEAKHEGLYHKINDLPVYSGSMTKFANPKPFDCFYINCPAYIVIGFYKPRQEIETYIVDIDRFIELRDITLEGGRKSLKQEEWEVLAIRNIML